MKFYPVVFSAVAVALALFSGCNAGSTPQNLATAGSANGVQSSGNPAGSTPISPGTGPGGSGPALTGEACTGGDGSKLCLAVHFVSYKSSGGQPVATPVQVGTIIHTMNTVWAQCDIGFQVEHYDQVDPTTSGLSYGAASQNELNQIRSTYTNSNDELLAVNTGPWGTAVNAWTNMPGDNVYGAIMEASIVDYGGGIIYAHEFGHYLGLDHVGDTSDLMNAVIYTTSTKLTASQCQTAQSTANSYWAAMLRK